VLLADDEMLDLEGMLRFIPWKELGMEVTEAVNSGFAAIEVLRREKIDILVTDIRMPNMTGLELVRKALEYCEDLHVIFVSGYQDFSYVKQALELDAYSYVLKPVDDQELIESLNKIKQALDEKEKRRQNEQTLMQVKPILKKEYLLRLLEGSSDPAIVQMLSEEDHTNSMIFPIRVAVLERDDMIYWKMNSYTDNQKQEMLHNFDYTIEAFCDNHHIQYTCKISQQRRVILINTVHERTHVLHQLIDHIAKQFPFTITIGLGKEIDNLENLHESYRQALIALDYKLFIGKGRCIHVDQIETKQIEDFQNFTIQLEVLFEAMNNYELVRIHDEIEQLFNQAMHLRSRFSIYNFAMYIILKLDGYLQSLNEDLFQILDMKLENLDILQHFETIHDIRTWLLKKVFEISELLNRRKQKKNWKLIRDLTEYIRNHLHDNITLRDVANRFSFSPNYLGLLFKEGTNQSFSEYLTSLRMEKACELLKEPNSKVYEVANSVGYRYLPYFSKQFKETYGVTPNEFRRNH
jgi:two-component system, response regulator YesN